MRDLSKALLAAKEILYAF